MNKNIILFLICLLFIISCNSIYETEKIQLNLKCGDITPGALLLGMSTEEAIIESCSEICLKNAMRYSKSYSCNSDTNYLICNCILTPERNEQLKKQEALEEQKKVEEAIWKAQNPGKLSDREAKELCELRCGDNFQFANNINHNFVECSCDKTYNFDYITKQLISKEEVNKRIQEWIDKNTKCINRNVKLVDYLPHYTPVTAITVNNKPTTKYDLLIKNELSVSVILNITYDRYSSWYGVNDKNINLIKEVPQKSSIIVRDSKFEANSGLPNIGNAYIKNIRYELIDENLKEMILERKECVTPTESNCYFSDINAKEVISDYIDVTSIKSDLNDGSSYTILINNSFPFPISLNITYDRYSKWYGVNDKNVNIIKNVFAEFSISILDQKFKANSGLPTIGDAKVENIVFDIIDPNLDNLTFKGKKCE